MSEIDGLHHVGHLVHDLGAAAARLERLGFRVDPPSFPALSPAPGEPARAVGAGNAHITFTDNFVEIVSVVGADGQVPPNAELVELEVSDETRPTLLAAIRSTVDNLHGFLRRFEGLHILMFASADPGATAERLDAAGIDHGGVQVTRRPRPSNAPEDAGLVRYLEIGDPTLGPGRVPEGRVGVAGRTPPARADNAVGPSHPNGAIDLVECVLCVGTDDLATYEQRYATYLDRETRPESRADARVRSFGLGSPGTATITLVTPDGLAELWPGEVPPAVPAMMGYVVAVADLSETADLLRQQGFDPSRTPSGDLLISAADAGGAAIAFRQP